MKKLYVVFLCAVMLFCCVFPAFSAVSPSTWAATDGLGRTLPMYDETGGVREEKTVAMFYWTWHYPWTNNMPENNAEMLRDCPEAANDFDHPYWTTGEGMPHFWDEPLFGYYSNLDGYVLRKHAELLADAGVDVIFFDCSNNDVLFDDGYEMVYKVFSEAKSEGVNVPKVSFLLNFFDHDELRSEFRQLYDKIYSKGRYEDLWYYLDGKPMLLGSSSALKRTDKKDREILDFFTFRYCDPTYFSHDTGKYADTWNWCSVYPQAKNGKSLFGVKQMAVSVAQNASDTELKAMNDPNSIIHGRSYSYGDYSYTYEYAGQQIKVDKNIENSLLYGINFQQQWDEALRVDPDIVFITGFNEWIAGRFSTWEGTENAFPDQYSPEFSRDIEPSKGILKDHYYYQLAANVRRFKGTENAPAANAEKTIDITAGIAQWEDVAPEFSHYSGSTRERAASGWGDTYYTAEAVRNDVIKSKVAFDDENVYFLAECADDITSPDGENWMRLFIDTDTTGVSDNWEGFEYVINRQSPENGRVSVERSSGGWSFEKTGEGELFLDGNTLQIAVPRSALGLDETDEVRFNFKWADNNCPDGDITDMYVNGEAAPGGRFTFVFDSEAQESEPEEHDAEDHGFELKNVFKAILKYIVSIFDKLFTRVC